jgi:hypothetical protein
MKKEKHGRESWEMIGLPLVASLPRIISTLDCCKKDINPLDYYLSNKALYRKE